MIRKCGEIRRGKEKIAGKKNMGYIKDKIRLFLNRETLSYLIVGILITVIDYVVFAIANESLKASGINETVAVTVATISAWIVAVVFAYITNKTVVFNFP